MPRLINQTIYLLSFIIVIHSSAVWAQTTSAQKMVPILTLLLNETAKARPVDAPIAAVETSIAAFIGETEKGLIYQNKPTKVFSRLDFERKFGRYTPETPFVAPALAAFFLNGGTQAYIVKTPDSSDSAIIGVDGGHSSATGLAALQYIDEVSIVVAPGMTSTTITNALIIHSKLLADRISIIDTPEDGNSVSFLTEANTGYINNFVPSNGHAALYTPWYLASVGMVDDSFEQMYIPPSGAVAGIYSRVDIERGVHKSPANEVIFDALSLKVDYSSGDASILNGNNVNTILTFSGRGTRIWGARTTSTDPTLKYISASRHLMFLKESIQKGTEWAAWETNDSILWGRVSQRISDFLYVRWRNGALQGATPQQSYFIVCDETTMTQTDIQNGRLVCLVGVALIQPAEFFLFNISQDRQ